MLSLHHVRGCGHREEDHDDRGGQPDAHRCEAFGHIAKVVVATIVLPWDRLLSCSRKEISKAYSHEHCLQGIFLNQLSRILKEYFELVVLHMWKGFRNAP